MRPSPDPPTQGPAARSTRPADLRSPAASALFVAVVYGLAAVAWLGFSDLLFELPNLDDRLRGALERLSPWIFLALSGTALYLALRLELRRRAGPVRALAADLERLQRHVDGTPLAWMEWDGELKVREWSRRAEELFGWTASEARGRHWLDWELVHPDERERHGRFLAGLGDRPPQGALLVQRNRRRDGSDLWCEWYVSWRRNRTGQLSSVFALARDVTPDRDRMVGLQTENRDLELRIARRTRDLAAARRDLQAFTHSLAHDLRIPVQAVIEYADSLRGRMGDDVDEESRRRLVYLSAAARQLDHLIDDLLGYARLASHQLERRPLELTELAREVVRSLEETFPEASSVITLPRSSIGLVADPILVSRALFGVLENALQYRDPHRPPRISVHATRTDQEVKVRIQDNGVGIPPEDRERVFRLFERLQSRETHPGSGVGLAVVRKCLELMGGTATIEAQAGPGTTVLLRLPAHGDVLDLTATDAAKGAPRPGPPEEAQGDGRSPDADALKEDPAAAAGTPEDGAIPPRSRSASSP